MKIKGDINETRGSIARIWEYLANRKLGMVISLFLAFIGSSATLMGTYRIKFVINDYILPQNRNGLLSAIFVLSLIFIIGALASWAQMQVILRVAYRTLGNIRKDLFHKIQKLPISFIDSHSHGDVMSLFTNDVDALQTTLEQSIVMALNSLIQIIGTILLMLLLSPQLFIITLFMTIVILLSSQILGKKSQYYFTEQQNDMGALSGYSEEMIRGHLTITVFQQEAESKNNFHHRNQKYMNSSSKALIYSGMIMPVVNQLNSINFALTTVIGSLLVLNGKSDLGSLSAYLTLSINYNEPFKQLSVQVNNVMQGLAGANRIFAVMDLPDETDHGNVTLDTILDRETRSYPAWKVSQLDNGHHYVSIRGNINFHHVDFAYEKGKTVLKNISFSAKPGQKIALVGSTGAGKTTITNLLNRFYNINQGLITYDGINICNIKLADLRKSLGLVLQDTHLFTGTIMENIRYGRLDAADNDIIAVAKKTYAHNFISNLPNGYNTILIRDGENLSNGQRQLIAIARTAISNPPVLILDEATSGIDTRTEVFVNKGMSELIKGRTVFIIAHRLSTVQNADLILVLEHGEIIEHGNHEQLIQQHGRYYQLNEGLIALE